MKTLGAEPLQPQIRGPAPLTNEGMRGQLPLSDTQKLCEQRRVHGDNELRKRVIAARPWQPQP